MAGVKYKVLLTRQKTQKNKRWAEGFLTEGEHGITSLCFLFHITESTESLVSFSNDVSFAGAIKLYDEDMKLLDSDFRCGSKVTVPSIFFICLPSLFHNLSINRK